MIFHFKKIASMFMKKMVGQFLYFLYHDKKKKKNPRKKNLNKPFMVSVHRQHCQPCFNQLVALAYWTSMVFLQCKTTSKLICQELPPGSQWKRSHTSKNSKGNRTL